MESDLTHTSLASIIDTSRAFYPELDHTVIEFRLVPSMRKALMLAQPKVLTLLGPRDKRQYVIKISDALRLELEKIPLTDLPEEVLIGWIGHELGHIMDYQNRGLFAMIRFGIGYWISTNYIRKAEYFADSYAIKKGLGNNIIHTKNYILNHAHIPNKYKDKIRRLYMSPDEVLMKVKEIEATVASAE